jgi:hypothetical protein
MQVRLSGSIRQRHPRHVTNGQRQRTRRQQPPSHSSVRKKAHQKAKQRSRHSDEHRRALIVIQMFFECCCLFVRRNQQQDTWRCCGSHASQQKTGKSHPLTPWCRRGNSPPALPRKNHPAYRQRGQGKENGQREKDRELITHTFRSASPTRPPETASAMTHPGSSLNATARTGPERARAGRYTSSR